MALQLVHKWKLILVIIIFIGLNMDPNWNWFSQFARRYFINNPVAHATGYVLNNVNGPLQGRKGGGARGFASTITSTDMDNNKSHTLIPTPKPQRYLAPGSMTPDPFRTQWKDNKGTF
jgi:hypothetical protein